MYDGYIDSLSLPELPSGGSQVGQISDFNQSKVFSIGKNFPSIPSPVGKSLGEAQKALRKTKQLIRKKQLLILRS
jgi:hypothetical protein